MPYTPQQEIEFKQTFARRRRLQWVVTIPFAVALFSTLILSQRNGEAPFGLPPAVLLPTCVVAAGAMFAFSLRNWRCPACNRYLGREASPKYCSRCGAALR